MSFSAVNMYRFVIAAVIFISFVSCVLAEAKLPDGKKNTTSCQSFPKVKDSKEKMMNCFNNTVNRHLYSSIVSTPGKCQNVADFEGAFKYYLSTVRTECDVNTTYSIKDLIKLIDFSLRNDSFKKFYNDISCVKNLEVNISNTCVKGNVGFFNITKEKKHTSWYRKANLKYDSHTCGISKDVKKCVENLLKTCHHDSLEYVASLFNYARELANCTYIESKATLPPPNGNVSAASSVMTLPVVITLSLGAVVVLVAIIIIIVLKCKNKVG